MELCKQLIDQIASDYEAEIPGLFISKEIACIFSGTGSDLDSFDKVLILRF